jgi:hypothetical protein
MPLLPGRPVKYSMLDAGRTLRRPAGATPPTIKTILTVIGRDVFAQSRISHQRTMKSREKGDHRRMRPNGCAKLTNKALFLQKAGFSSQ